MHYRETPFAGIKEDSDVSWIDSLAEQEGWIVCTVDHGMLAKQIESDAINRSNLTFLFFPASHARLKLYDKSMNTLKALPEILSIPLKQQCGCVLRLTPRYKLSK